MPAAQTSYTDRLRPAVAGMVAKSSPKKTVSKLVEPVGGLAFGVPAFRGTADNQAGQTHANGFLGATIKDITLIHHASADVDKYLKGEECAIITEGPIWVNTAVAVSAGDPVYVTPANTWTNVSNSDANTLVENAEWDSSNAAPGLAILLLK